MNIPSSNFFELLPHHYTILVVDDDPVNLRVISSFLEDSDFRMLAARDGESALERAQYGQPDLILLDVMMPGLDGFETCRRLKASTTSRDIPVIFMTALTDTQDKIRGFQLGAVDYITKPFQPEEVLARIRTHLALRAMQRQLEVQNARLQESEERLRTLINAMPDIVVFKDGEGHYLEVNDFGLRFFQLENVDYRGKNDSELGDLVPFYRDTYRICEETDRAAWQARTATRNDEMMLQPDGSPRVFDVIKVPTFYPGGQRKGIVVVGRDVTERKQAEEEVRQLNTELEKRVEERTAELWTTNAQLREEIEERKQAEEALRVSEERYRALYDDNPSMYFTVDGQGTVLSVNPFGAEQLGYTIPELVGQSVLKVFYPDDREAVQQQLAASLQKAGQVAHWEFRKVRKDGSMLWVREAARAVRRGDGKPVVLVVCEDITQQKWAEDKIRQRNRELTLLNRIIAAATSTLDVNQVLGIVCRELAEAFDLPQAAAALLNAEGTAAVVVAEYLEPGRPSGMGKIFPVAGYPAMEHILEHRTPLMIPDMQTDERLAPVREQLRPRGAVSMLIVPLMVRGEVVGTIGLDAIEWREFDEEEIALAQNVAVAAGQALETAQLHEALQRHAQRLEVLHDIDRAILTAQSSEAIGQAALRHLQQLVACRWAHVVLFDLEVAQGTVLATYANGQISTAPERHLPLSAFAGGGELHEGKTYVVEDTLTLANPPLIIQELQAEGLRSYISVPLIAQDQLMGSLDLGANSPADFAPADVLVAREVANQLAVAIRQTRLYEQEQRHAAQLARALARQQELDRLKSEFIQNVSHELRTPLALARGYAELLESGELGELQPDQREPVAVVARRLRMLTRLVEDINAILETETKAVRREPVDLVNLIRSVLGDFQASAEEHGLTLTVEVPTDLPLLLGDYVLLSRMLDNLLGNALKFTPPGGCITVRLRQDETRATLEVADTGIGIPGDQLERIFERFYQVDGGTSRRYGGTGLGLALVKEIVEAHDGQVTVESQVGQGSIFTVWLPLVDTQS
jgi:PAS domain S-box-containing protein